MRIPSARALAFALALVLSAPGAAVGPDGPITIDHYVRVKSIVPSMAGQYAQIYVRERVLSGVGLRGAGADGAAWNRAVAVLEGGALRMRHAVELAGFVLEAAAVDEDDSSCVG